jgi:hypothetical protein
LELLLDILVEHANPAANAVGNLRAGPHSLGSPMVLGRLGKLLPQPPR